MLHRVAPVRTDVSEESSASFIRVTRIGELGTTQAATSNPRMMRRNLFFEGWGGTYSTEKPKACLKTETDPVSETLCFLFVEIRTMDKVQKLSSNDVTHHRQNPLECISLIQ
jgi:hypothetical protein